MQRLSILLTGVLVVLVLLIAPALNSVGLAATPTATPIGGGGGKIAFVANQNGYPTIFLMNNDGSDLRPLRESIPQTFATTPSWSLDGKRILFSVYYESNKDSEIHIFDIESRNAVTFVITGSVDPLCPVWSPDNEQIAFSSFREAVSRIYVIDADGTNLHQLTNYRPDVIPIADEELPAWSPDGKYLTFLRTIESYKDKSREAAFYRIKSDGSDEQRLNYSYPAWSPDDKAIAYVAGIGVQYGPLCISDVLGTKRYCPGNITILARPIWSPDGKRIAFTLISPKTNYTSATYDLFTIDGDGTNLRRLTKNNNQVPGTPTSWSLDSKYISYEVGAIRPDTYIIAADGSNQRKLTVGQGSVSDVVWQPALSHRPTAMPKR
jgi:Tol biopolymer transport system component